MTGRVEERNPTNDPILIIIRMYILLKVPSVNKYHAAVSMANIYLVRKL